MAIKAYRGCVTLYGIPIPPEEIEIEFSGEHYLPKRKVREVFGWDEDTVCDLAKNSPLYGKFVRLSGETAIYHDQSFLFFWERKSVIKFYLSQVNLKKFDDLSWLEKKILAVKKLEIIK